MIRYWNFIIVNIYSFIKKTSWLWIIKDMLTIIRNRILIPESVIQTRKSVWMIKNFNVSQFARDIWFPLVINSAVTNMEFVVPRARSKDIMNRILRLHFRRRKWVATRFSELRKGWRGCGEHGDSIMWNFNAFNADGLYSHLYSHRASVHPALNSLLHFAVLSK